MAYIIALVESEEAETLCRKITADLPEYFGLPDCNKAYAEGVRTRINFAAKSDGQETALLSLEFPYPKTSQVYWMGVLKSHHEQGVGHLLMNEAVKYAQIHGALTMTVETLAPSCCDENYLKTYQFYEKEGFRPLFDRQPVGYEYPMVYMLKNLTL
jgi:GNAT superfamily N-acetyltransferase